MYELHQEDDVMEMPQSNERIREKSTRASAGLAPRPTAYCNISCIGPMPHPSPEE